MLADRPARSLLQPPCSTAHRAEKETIMAVQQNKKSRSRKGMRRSHDRVATPPVIYCSCGEPTVPHRVCPSCGVYKSRQVMPKTENE